MNFLKKFTVVALAAVAITACSDDNTGSSATVGGPKIRVVNSVYKVATPTAAATAISVDFMIDSAATGTNGVDVLPAAFDDIAPNTIAGLATTSSVIGASVSSTIATPSTAGANGFQEFDVGVHSYVAREADSVLIGRAIQFYTNVSSAPYLPRQYLTAGTYYTWILAGVITQTAVIAPSGANSIPFTALVDDPFPPPQLSTGTYQARYRIINAATYLAAAPNNSVSIVQYLSPDATTAPALNTLTSTVGNAAYRNASAYVNVTAGTYWLSLALSTATTTPVWQGKVTFAAGEVRTFILQNSVITPAASSATGTISPAPTVANIIKLTNILDQQY